MKHILIIKLSKRNKLLHFQNFILRTFLDNLSLEKNLVDSLYFYSPLYVSHRAGVSLTNCHFKEDRLVWLNRTV